MFMGVKEILAELSQKINRNPEGIAGLAAVYQIELSGDDGGTYQIRFAADQVEYAEGTPYDPKCTLVLSDSNFIKLVKGELNPAAAFMLGKLKVKGDLALSLKLQSILETYR
jgi:putative sterol carrier protein